MHFVHPEFPSAYADSLVLQTPVTPLLIARLKLKRKITILDSFLLHSTCDVIDQTLQIKTLCSSAGKEGIAELWEHIKAALCTAACFMSHQCGLSHAATELLHFSVPKPAKLWVKSVATLTFGLSLPSSASQKPGKENKEGVVSIHASLVLCWAWVCAALGGALEPNKAQIWTRTGPSPGVLHTCVQK